MSVTRSIALLLLGLVSAFGQATAPVAPPGVPVPGVVPPAPAGAPAAKAGGFFGLDDKFKVSIAQYQAQSARSIGIDCCLPGRLRAPRWPLSELFFGQVPKPGENKLLFPLPCSGHFLIFVRDVDVPFFQPKQSQPHV